MLEEERNRIRTAQREGIEIATAKGKFKGGKKRYHAGATGKDKLVYNEIVRMLEAGESVMDIHKSTGIARNTVYKIKRTLVKK
jgi:DNA invertase Pin-like site-specific DNA recombinase